MIFKRPVSIPALLCSIGLITTHGHNESGCIVGERKMKFTFFDQLIMVHLSLEPPGTHLAPHRKELNSKFVNNMSPEWDRGDIIRTRGTLVREMLQLAMGEHNVNVNTGQGKPINCFNSNGLRHIARNYTQPKHQQNFDYFKDKMLLMQAQKNGAVLDEEELLFLTGEQTNNFDADVDDHLQAGPSNASILSEVHDLENAIDPCDDNPDEHEIHNEVQQKIIIDSIRDHMGNSNVTPHEQYLSVNDESVVPSCVSSVSNDAYVLHDYVSYVPREPLVTELNIYKKQVAIYEQRSRAMKTVFENLEAEVDQNAINLKSAENSKLLGKIKNDDHDIMVKAFSKLEVAHLNLQLKHQHLKENIENLKSKSSKDVAEFDAFLNSVPAFAKYAINVQPIPPRQRNNRVVHHGYLNRLRDTLDTLREIVEEARSKRPSDNNRDYACVYTKRSHELLENVRASCTKADNK
uniref:Retrovirus-related Pol polyprotein from transposon TNT 1-94 n=1 Tax=Tanacetum cinerariifolium TaxID=118510 RepID=A0A6L2MA42_TANCI|nr:hypothetical protein [Tanacetum cinerariifolium]